MSDDSGRQKRKRFATTAAPSEEAVRQTRGSPIDVARDHVKYHATKLYDKLAKIVVRCASDFMTRRHNQHYKISSQHNLKSEGKYVPKSEHIKLDLYVENGTK